MSLRGRNQGTPRHHLKWKRKRRKNKMYKKDFGSSGYFERKPKDIEDFIQFYDNAEKLYDYFDSIKKHSLKLLIDCYDELDQALWNEIKTGDKEARTLAEDKQKILGEMIAYKLGLGYQIGFALDKLDEELQLISQSFSELDGLKNHRHKVGEGHYSEKPAW